MVEGFRAARFEDWRVMFNYPYKNFEFARPETSNEPPQP